jgi:flagella basal body P-ring formation protein FlgA
MKLPLLVLALLTGLAGAVQVQAQQNTGAAQRQKPEAIRAVVEQFLTTQSAGLPGEVSIKVGGIDPRLNLPACPAPQAFQQPGARPWGKTTVGVRCSAPAWALYVQAQVSVVADYVAAAVPLAQGQPLEPGQLVLMKADIAAMPNGIITDMAQAIGRSPTVSLAAGTALRTDTLRSPQVIKQGQSVRLVSRGANFSVTSEAKAINNASDGQVVQVRTQSGTVVSGMARNGGMVEIVL